MAKSRRNWYSEGLRFACTRCGNCCTGEGHVWVDPATIDAIAAFFDLEPADFSRRFVRRVGKGLSLVEKPNHDCVFWDGESGCAIYSVRPRQCRTFPFWKSQLASREAWDQAARDCPGMNRGPRFGVDEIRDILESD